LSKDNLPDLEHDVPEYKPSLVKVLNILTVFLALILILVIYIPKSIWNEEKAMRKVGHHRMNVQYDTQRFYKQMGGSFQTDPVLAMQVLTAVRDSTRADSNYFGKQQLGYKDQDFAMDVIRNFYLIFDTTFAFDYQKTDTVYDTTYQVLKWNTELFAYDTLYIHQSRIKSTQGDSSFKEILGYEVKPREQTDTYYIPYSLDTILAYQPLINERYIVSVKENNSIHIQDPLKGEYKERRYLFVAFRDTSYGYIDNGERSWER
jgi:hypothetical protein